MDDSIEYKADIYNFITHKNLYPLLIYINDETY